MDGGAPLQIDGKITLCGRSDGEAQRGYSGLLSELALFDTALTPDQAAYIYNAVRHRCLACCPKQSLKNASIQAH
jgi:hypothetical protein